MHVKFYSEKPDRTDHLGDLEVDGSAIEKVVMNTIESYRVN